MKIKSVLLGLALGVVCVFGGKNVSAMQRTGFPLPQLNQIVQQGLICTEKIVINPNQRDVTHLMSNGFKVIFSTAGTNNTLINNYVASRMRQIGAQYHDINMGAPYINNGRTVADIVYILNFWK